MAKDSDWLIMTYYCPTYGSEDKCQIIQLTKDDLSSFKAEYNKDNKIFN